MYNNVGNKIKSIAKVVAIINAIIYLIIGIVLIAEKDDFAPAAIGIWTGGAVLSWATSLFVYGFGQIVDDIHSFKKEKQTGPQLDTKKANVAKSINPIEELWQKGIITDEEYEQKMKETEANEKNRSH